MPKCPPRPRTLPDVVATYHLGSSAIPFEHSILGRRKLRMFGSCRTARLKTKAGERHQQARETAASVRHVKCARCVCTAEQSLGSTCRASLTDSDVAFSQGLRATAQAWPAALRPSQGSGRRYSADAHDGGRAADKRVRQPNNDVPHRDRSGPGIVTGPGVRVLSGKRDSPPSPTPLRPAAQSEGGGIAQLEPWCKSHDGNRLSSCVAIKHCFTVVHQMPWCPGPFAQVKRPRMFGVDNLKESGS
jgi:hypothetical protein